MRNFISIFKSRPLAAIVALIALAAAPVAEAAITITKNPPATIDNGEPAEVGVSISSTKQISRVRMMFRLRNNPNVTATGDNWVDFTTTNNVDFVGYIPILPAGDLTWRIHAYYTDGSSENTPNQTSTKVGANLNYNRFHDMKRWLRAGFNNDYYNADYGFVWEDSSSGSTKTNFTAATPNGSQWFASGVGWAATVNSRSPKLDTLPQIPLADLAATSTEEGMKYPVLFFFNYDYNSQGILSYVRTPKLNEGLGTISFYCKNSESITSRLTLQVAYTSSEPRDSDWEDYCDFSFEGKDSVHFTRVVNDPAIRYARIARTSSTDVYAWNVAFVAIDDICVTPPTPDVVMKDSLMNPGYPNVKDAITVRCLVSNKLERVPAINKTVTVHYATAMARDSEVPVGNFQSVTMSEVSTTNGWTLYEGTIPALGSATWLHYYFQCDFQGYYYTSPADNGMPTPAYFNANGSVTDAPSPLAETHLRTEVKTSRSRYSGVQVMQIVRNLDEDGAVIGVEEPVFYPMTLVDDNQWQVSMEVKDKTVTEAYFVGADCYEDDGDIFLPEPYYYGDTHQDEPYDTPTGGTPERSYGNTNSLPPIVIEVDCDGFMVYRFDDSSNDDLLNYTIRRGVFQDFDDWEEEGKYYVESLYGAGVATQESDFTGWQYAYGWLPEDDARENFELCASNKAYSVYADIPPRLGKDFIANDVETPNNWLLSKFRLTNERITNNVARFEYGGSSNVVAQVRPSGSFYITGDALTKGVGEVQVGMRSSVADDAKATYTDATYTYSTASPLIIDATFSIPTTERANSHYYASIVFDYLNPTNYHELRFTRYDSNNNADNRLSLVLAEVYNGVETNVVHKSIYADGKVRNETATRVVANITVDGATRKVTLTTMTFGGSAYNNWVGANNAITLNNCKISPSAAGRVGVGAYDCSPKFTSLKITGGLNAGDAYTESFANSKNLWSLGGTDGTEDMTKWYFDSGNNLKRRIPTMTVELKTFDPPTDGAPTPMKSVYKTYSLSSLQFTTLKETFHSWAPFCVEFAVDGPVGDCVVFDKASMTPWRGGTRRANMHANSDAFGWMSKEEQNDWATAEGHDEWVVFEGWAMSSGLPNSEYVKGTAIRFQHSQANSNLVQALYSPVMSNGVGTVKFNYHVTGTAGQQVVYAVEYTTADNGETFGALDMYETAIVYTNKIGLTAASGYRSCGVCTNYFDGNDEPIPMRCRIRVLDKGTDPDVVLWLDNVYANDFPRESDSMWKVYNGRLAPAGLADAYPRVYNGAGRTLFLNNSISADTGEARGLENPFDEWKPYLQAPYLEDGIGEIAFHYRVYNATNATTPAGKLTIAMSNDKDAAERHWEVITNLTVTGTGYVKFDDPEIFFRGYKFARFYGETNAASRVCIDNVLIMEPSRPGYDISVVELLVSGQQPVYSTLSNVAMRVEIGRLTQSPTDIRIFATWHVGTNVWGYGRWWQPGLEKAANTVELFTNGVNSKVFYTPSGKGLPAMPANGIIQYVVWGKHAKVPEVYEAQDVIFQKDYSFVNPEWYGDVDLNKTYGTTNTVPPSETVDDTRTPYYMIYSCPRGAVWINEIWSGYTSSEYWPDSMDSFSTFNAKNNSYEFVELAGRAGVDISGWKINTYKGKNAAIQHSFVIPPNTFIPNDHNGWGFYVISDEGCENADLTTDANGASYSPTVGTLYKRDFFYASAASPIGIELLRDGGVVEQQVFIGNAESSWYGNEGANYYDHHARFKWITGVDMDSGIECTYKGKDANNRKGLSYALHDNPDMASGYEIPIPCTNSFIVIDGQEKVWYWCTSYPTPGAVNQCPTEGAENVYQTFPVMESSSHKLVSMIVGEYAHGTQNGKRQTIEVPLQEGASATVVYVADTFYRISSLAIDGDVVQDAIGETRYELPIQGTSFDITNTVSFAPAKPTWTDDMISWFNNYGLDEVAITNNIDRDGIEAEDEYLLGTEPNRFSMVKIETTSIDILGDDVVLGLGLWRTNWSGKVSAAGEATPVTTGVRGAINVYGLGRLGGAETLIPAAQIAPGAFYRTNSTNTTFSLSADAQDLNFFIWKIE